MNSEGKLEGEEESMEGEWGWMRRKGYPGLGEVDAVLITGSRMWVPSDSIDTAGKESASGLALSEMSN